MNLIPIPTDKPLIVTADEDRVDVAMVMLTTKKMVSSDARLRHATAIVMLEVIGAEFQKEVDPLSVPKDQRGQPCKAMHIFFSTHKFLPSPNFIYFLIRLTQPKITLFTYQYYYITNAKIQSTNDVL